jgi:hypothetical protein
MKPSTEHLTRQLDLIPMEVLGEPITIIGAGAIGSWTCLALAKMGFGNLTVWDFDKVDAVNLNSQFYRTKDVGYYKCGALEELVHDYTGVRIGRQGRYDFGAFPGIVISAVDSMEVRKRIWDNHKDRSPGTRLIIDPRMGAETALLYAMNPMDRGDQASYEKTLYSDSEAVQERCTAKATIYTANMLSGLVCKTVKDVLTRPDYLRVAEWNIGQNAFQGFARKTG